MNSFGDEWILSKRGKKNVVDPWKPYAAIVEKELTPDGSVENLAVIFLTNSECPFHCLMCDLWKNTTDAPVPAGAISHQIESALSDLPPVRNVKLYNSGSFFDRKAIDEKEYGRIASILSSYDRLVIECHPKLINERVTGFRNMLRPSLEIAMGLETADEDLLRKLNKKMTPADFSSAAGFLKENGIRSRAFILLRPPFLSEEEGMIDAKRSVDFAFGSGVGTCTVIPVRAGNGAMDELKAAGHFALPSIRSLEEVLVYGINLHKGLVFADTWDLKLFSDCDLCLSGREKRITEMNLTQEIIKEVKCDCR